MSSIAQHAFTPGQGRSFDGVASLYDEVRPAYPAALFGDLERAGALAPASLVLEVGCGAGQATGDLARRAGYVLALDPGANLVAAARDRDDGLQVDFAVSTFEDFAAPCRTFDLIASAQAWHWVDPAVAVPKAVRLLRAGGWLAVFGHVPMPVAEPVLSGFRRAFARHAPGVWGGPPSQAWYLPGGPVPGLIGANAAFGRVTHRAYPWTWRMTPEVLAAFLRTDSSFHFLPEPARYALFDDMCEAVATTGRALDAPWETHLYLAQKR